MKQYIYFRYFANYTLQFRGKGTTFFDMRKKKNKILSFLPHYVISDVILDDKKLTVDNQFTI